MHDTKSVFSLAIVSISRLAMLYYDLLCCVCYVVLECYVKIRSSDVLHLGLWHAVLWYACSAAPAERWHTQLQAATSAATAAVIKMV